MRRSGPQNHYHPPVPRTVLVVAAVKGGTGKTTTAVHAAHALHEQGRRVVLGDLDPQRSALTWAHLAGFPFPTFDTSGRRLARDLAALPDHIDTVVLDTPPPEGETAIAAALHAATHVLTPCAPTGLEVERLRALRPLLDQAGSPPCGVLLSRTIPNAAMTHVYRAQLARDGWQVLRGEVRTLQRFAQSYGEPVTRASTTAYGDAVDELLFGAR